MNRRQIDMHAMSLRGRGARILLAVALAVGWQVTPDAVEEVDAADCVNFHCATLEFDPRGTGTGFISTNPYGIECEWAGSRSGTCAFVYSWSKADPDGIVVDMYFDPGVHTYACYTPSCGGLEQRLVKSVVLTPGVYYVERPTFNLANKTRVSLASSGTGAGRTTSSPGGLDCRWNGSAESGACEADVWWVGSSVHIDFTWTPDSATTFACSSDTSCSQPGATRTGGVTTASATYSQSSMFWVVKETTVTVDGPGTIVSSPAGISCPPTCSKWFKPLTVVTFTATPGSGATLIDWQDDCAEVPVSTMECKLGVGALAVQVGAKFLGPATPPPAVTPRPTVRPTVKPSSPPGQSAPPATTAPQPASTSAAPSAGASVGTLPTADPGSPSPGSSAITTASGAPVPTSSGDPAASAGHSPTAVLGSPEPGQAGSIDPGSAASPNALLLMLVLLLAVALGLVVGGIVVYWLVRRRGSRPPIVEGFSGGGKDA